MVTRATDLLDRVRAALADRYVVDREIGRGGMAIVCLARDLKHDRDVAIKLLRPEIAVHLGVDRFVREIQIEARLQHPNILPLHDSGVADGVPYYVMPYVKGESLRNRLEREGQLPVADALAITREVADALEYAHGQGIIHRDIKPENILLSEGHAVVVDFGIARAATVAGGDDTTTAGFVIGTPMYMSPEQSEPGGKIDARTDLYSLACVAYEMLAGEAPFTGPTTQAIVSKQRQSKPRPLRVVRAAVPVAVERALERALAPLPADRFRGPQKFVQAFTERGQSAYRRLWLAAAGAAGLAGVLIYLLLTGPPPLDASRYILATLPGSTSTSDSQALWAYEMEGVLRRVPGITLQDSPSIVDRVLRLGGGPPDLTGWLDIARSFGAGHALAMRTVAVGDSIELVVSVYDVAGGSSVRSQTARVAIGAANVGNVIARLVERLFGLPTEAISGPTSPVDEANRAYASGRKALQTWNLSLATTWFREAVRLDPDYGVAHLWMAKAGAWADAPAQEWIGSARHAVALAPEQLDPLAQQMARALLALAEGSFPQACTEFERLVAADSLSFEAWYGLGECHRRDNVVVRDPASPSQWRFRSSYQTALDALQRAIQIAPSYSFAAFSRVPSVLYAASAQIRGGWAVLPDTGHFRAYPTLDGDSIVFIPYQAADMQAGRAGTIPPSLGRAVASNRTRLLDIARAWSAAFPDSAAAARELARALELTGRLTGATADESALLMADRALRVSRTAVDSIEATIVRIRVRLRLSRFEETAGLGDSALTRWPSPAPEVSARLASVAALLGRPALSARLIARAAASVIADDYSGQTDGLTPAMVETWKAFESYAGVGGQTDSLRAHADRLAAMAAGTNPAQIERWNCAVWPALLALAYPELRRIARREGCGPQGLPLPLMHSALARGDRQAVLGVIGTMAAMRNGLTAPGDIAAVHVFHEAWATTEAGDTAAAIGQLDALLGSLASIRADVLDDPAQAGGLVRAMGFRAQLAAARGDRATASRWARAAVSLWRQAEPSVQPVVTQLTLLIQN